MFTRISVPCVALAVLLVWACCAMGAERGIKGIKIEPTPVKITDRGGTWMIDWKTSPYKGRPLKWRHIGLNSGRIVYTLRYDHLGDRKEGEPVTVPSHRAGLGMWGPTLANWSLYDFIEIVINGKQVMRHTEAACRIRQEHGSGVAEFTWDADVATIGMRFVLKPEDDKLFLECSIAPKAEITTLQVLLRNRPSALTHDKAKVPGKRWMVTAVLDEEEEARKRKHLRLALPATYWIFYADKVFDPAVNKSARGPSALLFLPEQVEKVEIELWDFGINTTIDYPADTRKFNLVFWEFPKKPNDEALRYLKTQAEPVRGSLEGAGE